MSNTLVTFDQFQPENLKSTDPLPQTIKKQGGDVNYNEMKLSYNYGTEEDPVVSDLFFELPLMKATGIRTKEEPAQGRNGPYTKVNHSMMLVFDLADSNNRNEVTTALAKLEELHSKAAHEIARFRGKLKMHDFDPARPGGMFKNPVYWPRDDNGEVVKGRNPNIWVKLRSYKTSRTLFTDMNGQVIDWKLLKDVDMELVPLIHVEKIYIGTKPSLQVYLASAIVTKIVPAGSETRQMSTLERLKAKYGNNKAEQVEAQLADLRMSRQDELSLYGGHEEEESSPGVMEDNESLQDFLGNAPTKSVSLPQSEGLKVPRLNVQPTLKIN